MTSAGTGGGGSRARPPPLGWRWLEAVGRAHAEVRAHPFTAQHVCDSMGGCLRRLLLHPTLLSVGAPPGGGGLT
eukprot:4791183-Alexandrium_andersonii.AAC.1